MTRKTNILSITSNTSTNLDGDLFFDFLKDNAVNDTVIVSIPGHVNLSSSFLNSSFGKYIDVFGMSKFKQNIKVSCNQSIFKQIKKYVDFYSDLVS
ncbi:STAS-like domain-containing protein [Maribacter cobaltidurans]|uniref:DUF4325 domain-containing protein n=1 Tax=Maribacter cobaltidurans TaxID=1178778 RepID=A0A223V5Q4_9FLAO|nr:DUF4325 domain-containing protein [Maribacter cobaltidurans]ASV30636.1 hypothetical protein CJ263_10660 [Maribacter cobaltidurans]GGD80461.1 hypothetical protein GCM10011412_17800 [Maribacter cobaltidurans]